MPTTARGIWTPADTDDWDLTVDLAATAVSVNTAIDNLRLPGHYVGTNAQRIALAAPDLREGITWRTTDTDLTWEYNGTAWLIAAGQLLATNYWTGANVTTAGAVLGGTVTTPTLPINQKFRINYGPVSIYTNAVAVGLHDVRYRKDGTTVTSATGTSRTMRVNCPGSFSAISSPGTWIEDIMTSSATVSAGMFLVASTGGGALGADGFQIYIETI